MFISTALLFCYFFLMYYGIRDDNQKERIAGFFMLGVSVLIMVVIGIKNAVEQPGKYLSFKEIVEKSLRAYFAKQNKKYGSRGLDFYVGDNHYWIEIRVDT